MRRNLQSGDVHAGRVHVQRGDVPMKRSALILGMVLALASPAQADTPDDRQRARAAYDRGTAAYKSGDYAAAAAAYAEADAIAPSDTALKAALDAAVKANDAVRGAELLERAHARTISGALATSVQAAEAKLGHRAGKVRLQCDTPCMATIDGAELRAGELRWAIAGWHSVVITVGARSTSSTISVQADAVTEVAPPKDAPPPVAPPPTDAVVSPPPVQPPPMITPYAPPPDRPVERPKGVGPALAISLLAGGVAASVAGVAVLFVAKGAHDTFVEKGCPTVGSADCNARSSDGTAIMILGEIVTGIGAAALISGIIVAAGFTRWKSAPVVQAGPNGAWLGWRTVF